MIKIKIKYVFYLFIAGFIYYVYQHVDVVDVKEKRKLIDIIHSSDRNGYVYVNYVWKDEYRTYVDRHRLDMFNYNYQKGKTYIHLTQELIWK